MALWESRKIMLCCALMACAAAASVVPNGHNFGGIDRTSHVRSRPKFSFQDPPPQPSPSVKSSNFYIDATTYGAKGDNSTDNTAPITAALNAAYDRGGAVVLVPTGKYRFNGHITIPPGVTLAGSFQSVPSHRFTQNLSDGTIFIPTEGRGQPCDINCTDAFITVTQNGVIRGLVILHDEQERVQTPVSYPWAIFLGDPNKLYSKDGSADNAAAMDIELLGAWNGIAAVSAHRHYIARIQGQPINIGVFLDATYDIGRVEDVHFNPWFSNSKPFIDYQTLYGRAFVMGRSDWEYVFNTFAFAYAIGYHFIERQTGSMNGNFLGIGADSCINASVQVDQSQPYGILITNGEFTAFCDAPQYTFCPKPGSARSPVHVRVSAGNQGAVKFTTSSFWGPASQIGVTEGSGTVSFTQCHFDAWDSHIGADDKRVHLGTPAFSQLGGTLILSDNEFTGNSGSMKTTHLEVKSSTPTKTIFAQNIIKGTMGVNIPASAKSVVRDNLDDS